MSWAVLLGFFLVILTKAPGLEYFLTSRDHGYQLCIATQILMGKVPGIDVVTAYGPLAMHTSALDIKRSDSLIGQMTLCVLEYAIGLFLIYWLVRRAPCRWVSFSEEAQPPRESEYRTGHDVGAGVRNLDGRARTVKRGGEGRTPFESS